MYRENFSTRLSHIEKLETELSQAYAELQQDAALNEQLTVLSKRVERIEKRLALPTESQSPAPERLQSKWPSRLTLLAAITLSGVVHGAAGYQLSKKIIHSSNTAAETPTPLVHQSLTDVYRPGPYYPPIDPIVPPAAVSDPDQREPSNDLRKSDNQMEQMVNKSRVFYDVIRRMNSDDLAELAGGGGMMFLEEGVFFSNYELSTCFQSKKTRFWEEGVGNVQKSGTCGQFMMRYLKEDYTKTGELQVNRAESSGFSYRSDDNPYIFWSSIPPENEELNWKGVVFEFEVKPDDGVALRKIRRAYWEP